MLLLGELLCYVAHQCSDELIALKHFWFDWQEGFSSPRFVQLC